MPSAPSEWNPQRIEQRASDILAAIARIRRHLHRVSAERFLDDELRQDAVARQILVVAEACDKIEELERIAGVATTEKLAARAPEIPWRAMTWVSEYATCTGPSIRSCSGASPKAATSTT